MIQSHLSRRQFSCSAPQTAERCRLELPSTKHTPSGGGEGGNGGGGEGNDGGGGEGEDGGGGKGKEGGGGEDEDGGPRSRKQQ